MQYAQRREQIPELDHTHQFIGVAARCSANVLISDGNRSARETLAGLIHQESRLCEGPFIVLNGPDISDWRPALSFQGSLFIAEAQDLNSSTQAGLLRFLEERAILPVAARVMAGAAGRLFDKVCSGTFSPELFYRLNVIHLVIDEDISDSLIDVRRASAPRPERL